MRRFPVDQLGAAGDRCLLSPEAAHHALRVCRLAEGEALIAFDGRGHQAMGRLEIDADGAWVRQLAEPERAAPHRPVTLLLALLKGDAMSRALRMATEAGATRIIPAISQRSVATGERRDRWERILESAAQQCGRADQPVLDDTAKLAQQLTRVPADLPRFVAAPGAPSREPSAGGAALAIGPEGGWTPEELRRFADAGWESIGLGSWVLRADTAVAVGVAALTRDP